MFPIISLLIILTLSILVTRIATVALTQTGLSRESARFQARSAFTGVGFTTTESEKVVNHPPADWLAERNLEEAKLRDEGVLTPSSCTGGPRR